MDGDKIELTCEGCGTLHITVRDHLKRAWSRITRLHITTGRAALRDFKPA
jgi:hypothetical protein